MNAGAALDPERPRDDAVRLDDIVRREVAVILRTLDLERGVMNAELGAKLFVDAREEAMVVRRSGHRDVRGESDLGRAHGPHVKIVYLRDAREPPQVPADCGDVDRVRSGVKREARGLSEEGPTLRDDEEREDEAHDRIEARPARQDEDYAGHRDPERDRRIPREVEENGARVEIVVARLREQERAGRVRDDGSRRHDRDDLPVNVGGRSEAMNRFPGDRSRHDEESGSVERRREDRGAAKPVGMPSGRAPAREHRRRPRQPDSKDVRGVVPGVGQKRHRACEKPRAYLDQDHDQVQRDADRERRPRRRAMAPSVGTVGMVAVTVRVLVRPGVRVGVPVPRRVTVG